MTNFDLEEITEFASDLNSQLERVEQAEGSETDKLDAQLRQYAAVCNKYCAELKAWILAVFKAKIEFDPDAEKVFRDEATRIYTQSLKLLNLWERTQGSSDELNGRLILKAALFDFHKLTVPWHSPRKSVAPGPRLGLPTEGPVADEIRRTLASLPPLPEDWEPTDPEQKERYRKALERRAIQKMKAE